MKEHLHDSDPSAFWGWFVPSESRFRNVEVPEKEALLDELLEHLQTFCPNLFFEVGGDKNGPFEFIVTAGGETAAFPCVRDLVASAPTIQRWQVIAFKPPQGFDFVMKHGAARLDPRRCWFLPLADSSGGNKVKLRIGCPGFSSTAAEDYAFAAWLTLDTGLGELAVAERIEDIELALVPDEPSRQGYMRLTTLPSFLHV